MLEYSCCKVVWVNACEPHTLATNSRNSKAALPYPSLTLKLQHRAINATVSSSVDSYKLSTPQYSVWKIKRLLRSLTLLRSVVVAYYFVMYNEKLRRTDN